MVLAMKITEFQFYQFAASTRHQLCRRRPAASCNWEGGSMKRDRRRYPRVWVALRVQVQAGDHRWTGTTVDVGPYGIKLTGPASDVALPPGSGAQVQVVLPDGQPPISLTASIV